MKLLAIHSAKAIWLVPRIFLNPKGKSIPLIAGLVERYKFAVAPEIKIGSSTPTPDAKFSDGVFTGSNGDQILVSLAVHDDGLVAETRSSTRDAESFLEDALKWAEKEYGIASYADLPVKRIYVSEVFVKFKGELAPFSKKFQPFLDALRSDKVSPMDLMYLNFGADEPDNDYPLGLRIERKLAAPFSTNQYFSFAKTQTDKHLALLEAFEEAAT